MYAIRSYYDRLPQDMPDLLQHLVPNGMTIAVIHILEAVEIHEQDRKRLSASAAPCRFMRQSLPKYAKRRKPGQRIKLV